MTTSRDTQRQKFEAREANIIAAASEVFASRGVDGAKMIDIARQAGLAEGTLYLYYRNKHDLLTAVVGHFWSELTAGARLAVDPHADPFQQLEQLASYHLNALLAQFQVVQLTYRARGTESAHVRDLDQVRGYVRMFDAIVERGIDRGNMRGDATLWQARDIFYGTLEFSARTLTLREASSDEGVVDNLMQVMGHHLIPAAKRTDLAPSAVTSSSDAQGITHKDLMEKLNGLEERLKALS